MPLIKSKSKAAIGENIREMESSGHSKAQSIAAALDTARKAGAHIPKPKEGHMEHKKAHHMHDGKHHKKEHSKMALKAKIASHTHSKHHKAK